MSELTPKQHKTIAALMQCRNMREAAQQVKVSERQLYRWMQKPTFINALRKAEAEMIDAATRRLIYLQEAAIGVITLILANKEIGPAVRLRAAQSVLDYLLRLRELRNVEDRLAALESAIHVNSQTA